MGAQIFRFKVVSDQNQAYDNTDGTCETVLRMIPYWCNLGRMPTARFLMCWRNLRPCAFEARSGLGGQHPVNEANKRIKA